jgi:putative copper export protein
MQAEPLIHWPEPIVQFVGFVAEFLAVGAVGFRYAAVRGRLASGDATASSVSSGRADTGTQAFFIDICARAAKLGLIGAIVQAILFANGLPAGAARAHTTVAGLLTTNLATGLAAALTALAVIGLALAASRLRIGWPIAALGIFAPLTGVVTGEWSRLVNPVHRLVAALWLGSLLVIVVAGLTILLRDERVRDQRGAIAADLINGFSPVALTSGIVLVLSGLLTAWRHLNPLSSLWTTPYGWTLIVKLAIVAVVFGLGAWNWRRQRPTLGSESAALAIRRSSTGELAAAALVLAVTAILVSLPSPRPPGARPPGAPPAMQGGAGAGTN